MCIKVLILPALTIHCIQIKDEKTFTPFSSFPFLLACLMPDESELEGYKRFYDFNRPLHTLHVIVAKLREPSAFFFRRNLTFDPVKVI